MSSYNSYPDFGYNWVLVTMSFPVQLLLLLRLQWIAVSCLTVQHVQLSYLRLQLSLKSRLPLDQSKVHLLTKSDFQLY